MRKHLMIVLTAVLFAVSTPPARAESEGVTVYTVDGAFADVLQDTMNAVAGRGFKIDHRSHIGDMLARTGADLGATKTIFTKAEAMQFCSAVYSRRMMEADPGNIAYCPYVIFVYERADAPGTVHVGFRRLAETGSEASRSALGAVNKILDEIVREGAGEF
jgi:hypothetical protein